MKNNPECPVTGTPKRPIIAGFAIDTRRSTQGEVAEWSNAPDSKSGIPVSGIVGSNPTLSAKQKRVLSPLCSTHCGQVIKYDSRVPFRLDN